MLRKIMGQSGVHLLNGNVTLQSEDDQEHYVEVVAGTSELSEGVSGRRQVGNKGKNTDGCS